MTPLTAEAKRIRRETIKLAQANGGYHFGGSFSCVEILMAYFGGRSENDVLVFSKGHGCWPLYVMLREQGLNPLLEGHPKRDPANGIDYTTGSLGHGLPAAVGMAWARKLQGRPGRVVAVIGDGDAQEGTCWESLLIAGRHRLDNLVVVYDSNGIQGSGMVADILPVANTLLAAVGAAGWTVRGCNGHDLAQLSVIFRTAYLPVLVFADTVKGRGVSFMEGKPEWHANGMTPEQTAQAMQELQ